GVRLPQRPRHNPELLPLAATHALPLGRSHGVSRGSRRLLCRPDIAQRGPAAPSQCSFARPAFEPAYGRRELTCRRYGAFLLCNGILTLISRTLQKGRCMRRIATIVLPLLLVVVAAAGIGVRQLTRDADAASAILYHPSADCSGAAASVTLSWAPLPGATDQWLEISLHDNGFQPETFDRVDPFPEQPSVSMSIEGRAIPSSWRIVSETATGDVASETHAFVPCGAPFLLWGPMECRNFTSASVYFRWAPAANSVGQQWLEFDSDGDWAGEDFWQSGPFPPDQERVRRNGFQNGVGYLFRVVRIVDGERQESSVGWFMPDCMPEINPEHYGSDDRLIVPSIGVDAPVNVLDVGFDAVLGVPIGAYDVVRYEFKVFPNLAGQVG